MAEILSNKLVLGGVAFVLVSLYLYKINQSMHSIPKQSLAASPKRWTKEEIRETYERVCKEPIDFKKHLPPRQNRRYVVVGGSGLVGGDIVHQLLARGQTPESIRIVDFQKPSRSDMLSGPAAKVGFVQTDITKLDSVTAAFSASWPSSVAKFPLTVFHTAAAIRPSERLFLFYDRCGRVNVQGTNNLIAAAKSAGVDIFVATSSASVAIKPITFFTPPWRSGPYDYCQLCTEADFDKPLRPHSQYFANYAYSKAIAERNVCAANSADFRTGCIRPGNGVYGLPTDVLLGHLLRAEKNVTFSPHCIQNFVSAWNVSYAHLLFEAALLPSKGAPPKCAGRPFVVTDAGPSPQFNDYYLAAMTLAVTPVEVAVVSPLLLYVLAHLMEAWCVMLAWFPFLTKLGLSEPKGPLHSFQPAVWTPAAHMMCVDEAARRSVADGGLGYAAVCTTMEGLCEQLRDWNRAHEKGDGSAGGVGDITNRLGRIESKIVEAGLAPEVKSA